MVSCGVFFLVFFSMELLIQRSVLLLVSSICELTILSCRMILACIKYLGNYPCPRCLISKADISKLGTKRDRKLHDLKERVDDKIQQSKIQIIRDWIYKSGYGIVSAAIERVLGSKSLIPTHVSLPFSFQIKLFLTESRMLSQSKYQNTYFNFTGCLYLISFMSLNLAYGRPLSHI